MWKDTEGHDIGGKWVKCWREAAYSPFNHRQQTKTNAQPWPPLAVAAAPYDHLYYLQAIYTYFNIIAVNFQYSA